MMREQGHTQWLKSKYWQNYALLVKNQFLIDDRSWVKGLKQVKVRF